MIRRLLLFIALWPALCMAQMRYCTSWQAYVADQWTLVGTPVELTSSTRQDALALTVRTADKELAYMLRHAFVVEQHDSLYINLRPFNTFGDVYVRAWRVGTDRLLFARQQVPPCSFKSISRLENLQCYQAVWDARRQELRLVSVTPDVVLRLLQGHEAAQQRYMEVPKKRRMAADLVLQTLQEAGVIR